MRNNPFHELVSKCFEQTKNSHDPVASYLSSFSLVLWKMLSERTGDKEFEQARTKAVTEEMAAELIHKGMDNFEKKYPDEVKYLFSMVLNHISFYNEDGRMLIRLMDHLSSVSVQDIFKKGSAEDYVGELHDAGFNKNISSGFSVSVYMLRLMRAALSIQEKDRIFAFGCAPVTSILDCFINEKSTDVSAQDMNVLFAIMAKIHLALFNIDHSRIVPQNFYEQPAFVRKDRLETFDCVFGVSHMGAIPSEQAEKLRNDRYNRFPEHLVDRFSKELVTLAHALKVLRPRVGRGAILLPQKFLSMMNTRKIRTYMVSMNYVDTVASLPSYLFPGRSTALSLLIFRMSKQDKKVLFIDAEPFCSKADRSIDQKKFLETYFNRTESENSMLVDNTEILGRDASLFAPVYQKSKPAMKRKSTQHLKEKLSDIDGRLNEVRDELDESLNRLGRS
ncbi:MAG: class I SAM-dependent DNA methyltransferase [Desulfonatronovibrio sp.]